MPKISLNTVLPKILGYAVFCGLFLLLGHFWPGDNKSGTAGLIYVCVGMGVWEFVFFPVFKIACQWFANWIDRRTNG